MRLRANSGKGESQLIYEGRDDTMGYYATQNQPLTQERLDYMMGIEFPKTSFPKYHQELIENSVYNDQAIILEPGVRSNSFCKIRSSIKNQTINFKKSII